MNRLQAEIISKLQAYHQIAIQICGKYARYSGIALSVVCVIGILGIIAINLIPQPATNPTSQVQGISLTSAPQSTEGASLSRSEAHEAVIKADVSGAVKQPGVKELREGDRVEDAIRAADGLTDMADTDYVAMSINLAAKVQDGDKIFIPAKGQSTTASTSTAVTSSKAASVTALSSGNTKVGGKISLNTASASQLDTLPGVGETYAQRIIENRPFTSTNQLCSKQIFRSQNTCAKILPLVSL